MQDANKLWRVVQTVELIAPAERVWAVVGGFYTIHEWHPDIQLTEVPDDQARTPGVRRLLTFPGQPKTTEELVSFDTNNYVYSYKWVAGDWGERVKQYAATIRVIGSDMDRRSIMQWSSSFIYVEDAVSAFYWNGFRALQKRFGYVSEWSDDAMGSLIELNDTLQITEEQGFPVDVFNREAHVKTPVTLKGVEGRLFKFRDKPRARIYQSDPVRVYFVHNINGKWLFWGRIVIESQTIRKKLEGDGTWKGEWLTDGEYRVIDVYDPVYQETFTRREAPPGNNYFE